VAQKANLSFKNKFPYIFVTDEASDFKFIMQLGFSKIHHQIPLEEKWVWPWVRKVYRIFGLPFNISATDKANDFKSGTQLGSAKAHHIITPGRKVGIALR